MDLDDDDLKKFGKYGKLYGKYSKQTNSFFRKKGVLKYAVLAFGALFLLSNIALSFHSKRTSFRGEEESDRAGRYHFTSSGVGGTALRNARGTTSAGDTKGFGTLSSAERRKMAAKMPQPGGFNDRVEDLVKTTRCSTNFFLAWTTKAEQFTLRYRRTVESTLRFHPDACVIVLSNTLPEDYFETFWNLGYNIIVERPDTERLIQGTPAEHWWINIEKWKTGPYFFSHITEILRLATLWHYGGVYLDTDVIIMKPLKPDLHNCLGTELAGKYGEAKVLNGAILIFEKGSRFVWEAMHEFNSTYRIDSWGWNGPELVTRVARRFQHYEAIDKKEQLEEMETKQRKRRRRGRSGSANRKGTDINLDKLRELELGKENILSKKDLTILPTDSFYPIHWAVVKKYFTLEDPHDQYRVWSRIEKNTYLFHYWNKITKDLVPEPGSLMYKVLNNYCLLCNESATDDGLMRTIVTPETESASTLLISGEEKSNGDAEETAAETTETGG